MCAVEDGGNGDEDAHDQDEGSSDASVTDNAAEAGGFAFCLNRLHDIALDGVGVGADGIDEFAVPFQLYFCQGSVRLGEFCVVAAWCFVHKILFNFTHGYARYRVGIPSCEIFSFVHFFDEGSGGKVPVF